MPFIFKVPSFSLKYANEVLADTPLHYWRLGDSDPGALPQPVTDQTGNFSGNYIGTLTFGRPGILANGAGISTLHTNSFPGGIDITDSGALTPNGSFAIEGWIKLYSTPTIRQDIMTKETVGTIWPEYTFLITDARQPLFALYSQNSPTNSITITSSTVLSLNTSYHLVFVFRTTDNIGRMFINGVQDTVGTPWPFLPWDSTSNVAVGFGDSNSSWGADADMQEFAYYDHDLSDARILAHYNAAV